MSIEELDLILKKDPIIATWSVSALRANPAQVEQDYATHAKTHLSLGDTQSYVDTLFRWIGGANKGAFIGAVEGDYGEGKTSFLVHLWAESVQRRVFAVPPFEWMSLADAIDGLAAWMQYVLGKTHPELGKRALRVHQKYTRQALETIAAETAKTLGQEYDTVLATLQALAQQGTNVVTETSAERFLDYCAEVTEIVKSAGYVGLLVLLDEPEVAAKHSTKEKVALWLFELANELHRRDGDYGVFVSMPTNFLADIQRRYSALPARLQVRNCFPRLRDVYGPDFAQVLWARYAAEFSLGEEAERIVSPLALQAIGQVGSSERGDLSYGPRTVVSAFNRMIYHYRETGSTYEPESFVQDCLDDEIMIKSHYPSTVNQVLRSPEVDGANRDAVLLLAACPDGLRTEIAKEKGITQVLLDLCRAGSLAYKTVFVFGLRALRPSGLPDQVDPLRDLILDIASQFAPTQKTFAEAMGAFQQAFIPLVFQRRQGQQLVGWEEHSPWKASRRGAAAAAFIGAFQQTHHHFPRRAVLAVTGSVETPINDVPMPKLPETGGSLQYDGVFHFRFRWHDGQEMPNERLTISMGDPARGLLPVLRLTIDLQDRVIQHDTLAEVLDASTLTPLFLLYLINRMDAEPLPKEIDAQWQALRNMILRELVPVFLDDDLAPLAAEQLGQPVSGSGLELLGTLLQKILQKRYPTYSTLIRSPHWEQRVDDYVRALKSSDIPLACKRGREPWVAEGDLAPNALDTSRMNLTGSGFAGFERLLTIRATGPRNAPIEVQFHIHPLEQQIVDLITSEPEPGRKKLEVDGKECWWLPVDELLPIIKESGYTLDELKKIIDIGTSRGSYNVTDYKGQRVLYCMPIDPEQMRDQLRGKLAALLAEIDEFKKIPDFTTFDPKPIAAAIEALQDEADYERIMSTLNRAFEQLHSKLPTFYTALQQRFVDLRNEVKDIPDQLAGRREVASLKTLPSGKSRWCADLSKFIVGNLKKSVDALRGEAAGLAKDLEAQLARYSRPSGSPMEAVAALVQGHSLLLDMSTSVRQVRQRRDDLVTNLRDYDEWLGLLRRSDEIYEDLLQLRAEELHRTVADGLLADHDRLSQQITDHLQVRNVLGLASYKQFAATLDDIYDSRRKYLNELKSGFDKRKDAVNRLLDALNLGRRVSTVFNPMDVEGCYTEMFELGAGHIREAAIARPLHEVEAEQRELIYAKDVLKSVPEEEAAPLLDRLAVARSQLVALESTVTREWVQIASDPDSEDEQFTKISDTMTNALAAVREARELIKANTRAAVPTEGRSKSMHDQIPEKGSVDLKQLILQMMADTGDPSLALDESLASLVELFRRNCVQITIERRRM